MVLATSMRRETVLFGGWFGPRGLASIAYGLVILDEELGLRGVRKIVLVMVVTVMIRCSPTVPRQRRSAPATAAGASSCHPTRPSSVVEPSTPLSWHSWTRHAKLIRPNHPMRMMPGRRGCGTVGSARQTTRIVFFCSHK
jgi:hypothetical protein